MNWFAENKFLTGLLAVMAVLGGVLVFLLLQAKQEYAGTSETYNRQAAELARLQALKPYPEQQNLDEKLEQKEAFVGQVNTLRNRLAALENLPENETTPEQFQDSLRRAVSEVQELAAQQGTALPEGFYLGFPQYQASPPRGEIAPRLKWQLAAVESVVKSLIQNRVTEIQELAREPLPGEAGSPSAAAPARDGAAAPPEDLVQRYRFTITFLGEQSRLKTTLNQLANTKEQFLIVESLTIENEKLIGPEKGAEPVVDESAASGDAEALATLLGGEAPPEGAAPAKLSFIVGTEKLKSTLRIAVVDFAAADESTGEQKEAK